MKTRNEYLFIVFVTMILSISIGDLTKGRANKTADPNSIRSGSSIEFREGTVLVFAEPQQAREHLMEKDDFIKNLSPFDRSARLATDKPVTEEEFLKYVAEQILPWTDGEKKRIREMVESIANRVNNLEPNLPPEILLIKTTGREEGGASYCRANAIVLPSSALYGMNVDMEKVLIHELFHIISANNSKLREALYNVINFRKCNDVELPAELRDRKITNPDGIKNDHYIELKYKDGLIRVIPILYSFNEKYDVALGGSFFSYMRMNLLALEKAGDKWRYKSGDNGKPVLLTVWEVPDYNNKIGLNTEFTIHPDEILAENFVLMVQETQPVKSEWVIENMKKVFQEQALKKTGAN